MESAFKSWQAKYAAFIVPSYQLISNELPTSKIIDAAATAATFRAAQLELSELNEWFEKPEWVGEEVTEHVRYYNNNLAKHPYSQW